MWSSLVHAVIMAFQAMNGTMHRGHLLGDVPGLILIALVLGVLMKSPAKSAN